MANSKKSQPMHYPALLIRLTPDDQRYKEGKRLVLEQVDYDQHAFANQRDMNRFCTTHCLSIVSGVFMAKMRKTRGIRQPKHKKED